MSRASQNSLHQRLARFRELLAEHKLPAFYLSSYPNRRYLSGFTGTRASLLIARRHAILLTDFRYLEQARDQAPLFEVREFPKDGQELPRELITKLRARRIGIEAHHLSVAHHRRLALKLRGIRLVHTERLVEQLRTVKDHEELRLLKRAIAIGDQAFLHARKLIIRMFRKHRSISERAVAWEMEKFARSAGAEKLAFDCIVASDKNASRPHHPTGDALLKRNSFVIIDFGVVVDGYHSDMTRTLFLGSKPSAKQRAVYELVLKSQEEAQALVHAGIPAAALHAVARAIIRRAGYGQAFGHGLGHGVGLEVHEAPTLAPRSKDILTENEVVSVEPGIYLAGWGGVRIEDLVLVKKGGCRVLTKAPKRLKEMCIPL